jgi:hypothetical protein
MNSEEKIYLTERNIGDVVYDRNRIYSLQEGRTGRVVVQNNALTLDYAKPTTFKYISPHRDLDLFEAINHNDSSLITKKFELSWRYQRPT